MKPLSKYRGTLQIREMKTLTVHVPPPAAPTPLASPMVIHIPPLVSPAPFSVLQVAILVPSSSVPVATTIICLQCNLCRS